MKILFLSEKLNAVSGVSKHLYYLSGELKNYKDVEAHFIVPGGDYLEQFQQNTRHIKILPQLSFEKRSPINFIYSTLSVAKYCIQNKIDIIHSHTHYCANIGWYAAKLCGTKTIQTNHGIIPEIGKLNHFKAQHYISVNKNSINHLIAKGFNRQNLSLSYCGLRFPEQLQKPKDTINIVLASRLIKEKGTNDFAHGLLHLNGKLNREIKVIIAGEGEQEPEIKEILSQCNIDVEFKGIVKDLNIILKESHIFVFPSYSESEGFPLSVIEAALNGNLIITTDFVSLREVFDDNDVVIIKEKEPEDLAEKLELVINDFDSYSGKIQNSRCKAKEVFDLKNNTRKTVELYKKVLNGK